MLGGLTEEREGQQVPLQQIMTDPIHLYQQITVITFYEEVSCVLGIESLYLGALSAALHLAAGTWQPNGQLANTRCTHFTEGASILGALPQPGHRGGRDGGAKQPPLAQR